MNIKILHNYIDKWWLSILIFIACSTIGFFSNYLNSEIINKVTLYIMLASMLGVLLSIVYQFVKRRWKIGLLSFFAFIILFILIVTITSLGSLFEIEDDFANNLVIPNDIVLNEPSEWSEDSPIDSSYQDFILSVLADNSGNLDSLRIDFTSLRKCFDNQKNDLILYLSVNPAWRVFQKRGNKYATRRWNIDDNWKYSLHGYYTNFSLGDQDSEMPNFQNKFTIGLSGETWIKNTFGSTIIDMKTSKTVLSARKEEYGRFLVFDLGNMIVESFEKSPFKNNVLSQASFNYTKIEFEEVLNGNIENVLPDSAIRQGEPVFNLHNHRQGGIYSSEIWINPGESGMIYLKAFEVTKNTELSTRRLEQYSNEWIGWSKNPKELFYSNTLFTIYEGDWDKHYAARFEIWFAPDSGDKERKLMEKTFKIEGWER